ncbi:Uncharacterised protein [Lelliottia amnigena]|nr:Uncharacterised protein [Lelliottia amnigena]
MSHSSAPKGILVLLLAIGVRKIRCSGNSAGNV